MAESGLFLPRRQQNACAKMPFAIIVDIDETLCTQFDVPVESAISVLRRIDELKLEVHYVTARTSVCRVATEKFIRAYRLPGVQNVHYCPAGISSLEHKRMQHQSLGQELRVLASIGDSFEEELAAAAVGIPFVMADPFGLGDAWTNLADRIAEAGGFKP